MTKEEILRSVKSLPREEQVDLVFQIWDGIEGYDPPLSEEMKAELDRRIAEDDADDSPPEDYDVFRAKLLRGEI